MNIVEHIQSDVCVCVCVYCLFVNVRHLWVFSVIDYLDLHCVIMLYYPKKQSLL